MHLPPFPRRRFMRGAAAVASGLAFESGLRRSALAAPDAPLVDRRIYFDNPDIGSVVLSHDGRHLAWLAPVNNVRNLFVAPADDLRAARQLTHATDRNLAPYYAWAHNNRRIVFFQERDGDENWRGSSVDIESGAVVPLTPERGVRAFVQEIDRRFPDEMLMRHNERDKRWFDLYRINVVTGK